MPPPFALLHVGARLSWTTFTVHPSTVIGLTVLGAIYTWRSSLAQRGTSAPLERTQPILFASALAVMFLSLNGWLHDLSDSYLFTAHMVQHLILPLVFAPFLIMGTPGWMLRPLFRPPPIPLAPAF